MLSLMRFKVEDTSALRKELQAGSNPIPSDMFLDASQSLCEDKSLNFSLFSPDLKVYRNMEATLAEFK